MVQDITWELILDPSVNTLPISRRELNIDFWKGDTCLVKRTRIDIPTSTTGANQFYSPLYDVNSEDGSGIQGVEAICADKVSASLRITMTDYSLWNSLGKAELVLRSTGRKDLAANRTYSSFTKKIVLEPGLRYVGGSDTIELNNDFIGFELSGNNFIVMEMDKVLIPERFLIIEVNLDNL